MGLGISVICLPQSFVHNAVGWADQSDPNISEANKLLYIKVYLWVMFKCFGKEANRISDLDIEFVDLHLKLVDLSLYYCCIVLGLAMVTIPGADILHITPVQSSGILLWNIRSRIRKQDTWSWKRPWIIRCSKQQYWKDGNLIKQTIVIDPSSDQLHWRKIVFFKVFFMGLLPDMQNFGLRMRQECRDRFLRLRVLAIPTCITARACRDR